MKNRLILLFPLFVLMAAGCSKDQKAVNQLEGTWGADKMEVTYVILGTSLTLDVIEEGGSAIFSFTRCKLKDLDWCPFSMNIYEANMDTSFVQDGLYRVVSDGTVLETKESETADSQLITIDELTKSSLKISFASSELGGPVVAEFSR